MDIHNIWVAFVNDYNMTCFKRSFSLKSVKHNIKWWGKKIIKKLSNVTTLIVYKKLKIMMLFIQILVFTLCTLKSLKNQVGKFVIFFFTCNKEDYIT